ncbi:hypothetical protein PPERSA_04138 [Pseudocohnilembus persalinus]|uniref:Uncharacterized protein n=1 Tax=Pseudocohnilembus persalinus TaxID=266149 RepID=A0A0V0QMV4_PSEPJ|nr:hypothetical protein PPERSA_04138 [Pseudocohnilembus persalinus]|eukprot:KRX03586.1 hypothetical protein PPERSA_04138 [Pseudocohnilembus persalinus]
MSMQGKQFSLETISNLENLCSQSTLATQKTKGSRKIQDEDQKYLSLVQLRLNSTNNISVQYRNSQQNIISSSQMKINKISEKHEFNTSIDDFLESQEEIFNDYSPSHCGTCKINNNQWEKTDLSLKNLMKQKKEYKFAQIKL